jgi:hypothetical protein
MTDYGVRYQCQGCREDGFRCTRRGRITRWYPAWLCWQHVRITVELVERGEDVLLFSPLLQS